LLVFPSVNPKHLFEKLVWEAFRPRKQFGGDVCFQNSIEFIPRAVLLVAGRFVNKGNDAYT
jgi:hypothetical protein